MKYFCDSSIIIFTDQNQAEVSDSEYISPNDKRSKNSLYIDFIFFGEFDKKIRARYWQMGKIQHFLHCNFLLTPARVFRPTFKIPWFAATLHQNKRVKTSQRKKCLTSTRDQSTVFQPSLFRFDKKSNFFSRFLIFFVEFANAKCESMGRPGLDLIFFHFLLHFSSTFFESFGSW